MVNQKKLELIEELKVLRKQLGITYQEIADQTAANGMPVSLSTIKLVFSDKHLHDHDYNNVLKPIADVLTPSSEDDPIELKILQTRLELKEELINDYQSRLDTKDVKYRQREQFYMKTIEHLQKEIEFKNSQIQHHYEAMDRKDAVLKDLYDRLLGV